MRYMGGKFKVAKPMAHYLNGILAETKRPYWEPFVGAGYILERVHTAVRFASDANKYLIAMYQALQNGWEPPTAVSREQYHEAKNGRMPDPETAFIGFGCSFAGKWFDGYAEDRPDDYQYYARFAHNSLMRQKPKIETAVFYHADFLTTAPPAQNCVIYCDPPYKGTKPYKACEPFNHEAFWERIRELEGMGHSCVISEYQAPADFTAVWVQKTRTDLRDSNGKQIKRVEKLFRYGTGHGLVNPTLFRVGYDEFIKMW